MCILTIDQIDLQAYETADEKYSFTQKDAIKAFLRSRPDIINVGEIRDEEQVKSAYKSAITGHLVFGSLHVNSTIVAMNRMSSDGGIDIENIKSIVRGVLYQKLTRKLCDKCKVKVNDSVVEDEKNKHFLDEKIINTYRANIEDSCIECDYGYSKLETPVVELAEYPIFREYKLENTRTYENYRSLQESALEKYIDGLIDKLHYETIATGKRIPSYSIIDSYYAKNYHIESNHQERTKESLES